jgi:hypothetical protein
VYGSARDFFPTATGTWGAAGSGRRALGSGGEPSVGVNMKGYVTVTRPPSGAGNERPFIARATHAATLAGSSLSCADEAATKPSRPMVKRTATRPPMCGSWRKPSS